MAAQAWESIAPLQHMGWAGRLLVPEILRARGKTSAHLTCLNSGLRNLHYERQKLKHAERGQHPLLRQLAAMAMAAETGMKDHDRWLQARRQLERKLEGRRSTSSLPGLVEMVLSTPIVSAAMIAAKLGVTPRAAQDLVAELGLREVTGRGRYRAWGIL